MTCATLTHVSHQRPPTTHAGQPMAPAGVARRPRSSQLQQVSLLLAARPRRASLASCACALLPRRLQHSVLHLLRCHGERPVLRL